MNLTGVRNSRVSLCISDRVLWVWGRCSGWSTCLARTRLWVPPQHLQHSQEGFVGFHLEKTVARPFPHLGIAKGDSPALPLSARTDGGVRVQLRWSGRWPVPARSRCGCNPHSDPGQRSLGRRPLAPGVGAWDSAGRLGGQSRGCDHVVMVNTCQLRIFF